MNTSTEKLVMALRVMAAEIQSDDGVANAAIHEAALRLEQLSEKIKRLYDSILKNNQEIEQDCGKVLGYPWFKDDQKNFPGATEKDGVCVGDHVAETIVSELAKRHTEALARIKRLEEESESRWMLAHSATGSCAEMSSRIKRLEEAGDKMASAWDKEWLTEADIEAIIDDWHGAKEAKP